MWIKITMVHLYVRLAQVTFWLSVLSNKQLSQVNPYIRVADLLFWLYPVLKCGSNVSLDAFLIRCLLSVGCKGHWSRYCNLLRSIWQGRSKRNAVPPSNFKGYEAQTSSEIQGKSQFCLVSKPSIVCFYVRGCIRVTSPLNSPTAPNLAVQESKLSCTIAEK